MSGLEVHSVDVGFSAHGEAHNEALAVRRKSGREGHASKFSDHLMDIALKIMQIDARRGFEIGDIGDFLQGGAEAGREDDFAPFCDVAIVGAILIHDGEALDALFFGSPFLNKDDLGVEIAAFACEAVIDGVGDEMGELPFVGGACAVAPA